MVESGDDGGGVKVLPLVNDELSVVQVDNLVVVPGREEDKIVVLELKGAVRTSD